MLYKYSNDSNYEDLAAGRVIIHKSGFTNFPVRLADEIFIRCLNYLESSENVSIYDPCCGGGYLLTILGFLNINIINSIIASDISDEALCVAQKNLSLLTKDGLTERTQHINNLYLLHSKQSHLEALDSTHRLLKILNDAKHETKFQIFNADILTKGILENQSFRADIVFLDVPYGNLVKWKSENADEINLLDNLLPVITNKSVVAICSDKSQRFTSNHFKSLEKQMIGKRKFQIFKLH